MSDTKTKPDDYDLILSGDLGFCGSELLLKLLKSRGVTLSNKPKACGENATRFYYFAKYIIGIIKCNNH